MVNSIPYQVVESYQKNKKINMEKKSKVCKKYRGFLIININKACENNTILKTLIQNNSYFSNLQTVKIWFFMQK